MKKFLKVAGIILLVFIIAIIAIPFVFKGKIEQLIKDNINKNLNAKLEFAETDISLIRNFPNASIQITNLTLTNYAPFQGDTLVSAKDVNLKMSLSELMSISDGIKIDYFSIDGAKVNVRVNKDGLANYDIAKETTTATATTESSESSTIELSVQGYEITNSYVDYNDESLGMEFIIDSLNHSGSGDLSAVTSELDTKTTALVSFVMDSTAYLSKNPVQLDAVLGVDLEKSKYTFLDNKLLINQLPLVFDGYVQVNENNQELDITFETPSSDFKNFLAVIPEAYAKDLENVQTQGEAYIKGKAGGVIDDDHIPTFDIEIASNNAMFKYPDLPKAVKNIDIKTIISNTTGITNDTEVNVENLAFTIDQDSFKGNALINNIIENPKVKANVGGRINLANLSKAYPVELDIPLSGILDANIATAFDMESIEKEQYQNTKNSGNMTLSGFTYNSEDMKNPLTINKTSLTFNTTTVSLNEFDAKSGTTDIEAKGTITNFLGYMFNDELLKGNFTINSDNFNLNDFMVEETEVVASKDSETKTEIVTTGEEQIKIPAFLDATVAVNAKKVKYDNLDLTDAKGTLVIKDETATLKNVSTNLLGGNVTLNGNVSTKGQTPNFDMDLGINSFTISKAFEELDLLKALAPIAQAIEGKLNSSVSLSGNLDKSLAPDLTTLSGNLLAELLNTDINAENSQALSLLNNNLKFIDLDNLNLKDLKAALTFENGKVNVKPFQVSYKDVKIDISGSHGFDKSMSYNFTFDVPAKYLGSDISKLISQLNDTSIENTKVPVTANLSGTFTNPKVNTDIQQAVTNLTKQLVEKQKQQLIDKGKDKAQEAISNIISGNTTKSDTTKTNSSQQEEVKSAVKDALNGLFGKKKEE
ncbi:Uncharacterized protein involved in outer membrane biogenesis [Pustulibacterium marinum]|uniref:Uncharacterized protein involved in outer membrane biogenesis n=1 Tax=Pustulibacterium marinum TaxID=1224947 RepID=A0A1I7GQP3_9FLAO|nr:AsmA-like C-terminal region-containing protein [Pustulibacterium marinum]SFU50770.1 Uncharacterized protein involved in outer membrane biogenesis [Pustulibacterium marinum]